MQRKICPTCNISYPARLESCPEDGTRLETPGNQGLPWPAGKLVAYRYVIFAETGSNEVTRTYRVRSLDVDEIRSLRLLQPAFSRDKAAVREFRGTARLLRNLQHPNLVAVEAVGDAEDETPFMVTEVVPGRSLEELLRAEGPLPAERVCSIARQVAAGLGAAHGRGLLHLGLNPSVISIAGPSDDEMVKVDGFGAAYVRLSRTRNRDRHSGLALRDLLPANTWYCSPEQALGRHAEGLDARADLYSLGVMIFQMLTAKLPFSSPVPAGASEEQARLASLVDRLEEADSLSRNEGVSIPEPLAALITHLLQKRPQLRPATAQQVVEKIGLAEDWIANRALMGLSSRAPAPAGDSSNGAGHDRVASVAALEPGSQEQAQPGFLSVKSQAGIETEVRSATAISALDVRSGPAAEVELLKIGHTVAPAESAPSDLRRQGAILFIGPAPRPRERGRWALAALALVIVVVGAFLLITHGLAPGPGPLSPARPDELQGTDGAASSATASNPSSKPQQTKVQPQGRGSASGPVSPAQAASPTPRSDAVTAEVQQAIKIGDIFFEQGKYDLAIQTYARPLKLHPTDKSLRARIARARKAEAAEEEYLGQQ
ncbi:MAG TPA: protein kinase [Terriglobia bacterium]|nr:protein kinase [Terriglobia bacterium]